jgi:hypothetical protein
MVVADILRFWYGSEVPKAPRRLHGLILTTADAFSMPILIRTIFAPWRKDVLPTTGMALQERFQAMVMNMVSVLIGFVVRFFVLLAASLTIAVILLVGSVALVLWVIMPAVPFLLIICGVVLLFR